MPNLKPLPSPPSVTDSGFDRWMFRFYNETRVTVTDTAPSSPERLTATQAEDLTDGGDSTLHYHAEDRDRQNHTGTQTVDTISDFTASVLALASTVASSSSSGPLEAQIFGS